jgi:hypothetical protein
MLARGIGERLPHVHHGELDAGSLGFSEPFVELGHACFRAILAAEPDRTLGEEVADDDAIRVPFADRYLVDSDRGGSRRSCFCELRSHVLHVERLHSVPVESQFVGDVFHSALPATASDVIREPLGVGRIVGQERQPLALHAATTPARDAPNLHLQMDVPDAPGEIAHQPNAPVVPAPVHEPAAAADRFFERRSRLSTRTCGSPSTSRTVLCARNPGKEYMAASRWGVIGGSLIREPCQESGPAGTPESSYPQCVLLRYPSKITHTIS